MTITGEKHEILTEICIDVISHVINRKYALCVIFDSCYLEKDISDCLESIDIPLLNINPENYKNNLDQRRIPTICDGYLIISNNSTYLKHLFNYKKTDTFQFQAHKRIIIIYDGVENFTTSPFQDVAQLQGNNIIAVDNFNRNTTGDTLLKTVRVTSVLDNKIWNIWDPRTNRIQKLKDIFEFKLWEPDFRRQNRSFKVASFNCPPFIYTNSQNEVYDGIDFHFIKLLLGNWPLTFKVYNITSYMNMYFLIMRNVHHNLEDMGTCSIWQQAVLDNDLDYTHTYSESCSTFLVPKSHEITRIWFVYYPIDNLTWIFIGITAITMGIFLNLTYRLSNEISENYLYYFIQSTRILSVGAIEKFPKNPNKTLRPILALCLLTSLIITTSYSGGFSSISTRPKLWDLKTMADMVKYDIEWGSDTAFVQADVLLSIYPGALKIGKKYKYEKSKTVQNKRIRSKKYGTAVQKLLDGYVTGSEELDEYAKKQLKILPQCYMRNALVYILSPNSPYKETLNNRVLQITEHGFVHYWINNVIIQHNMFYMYRFFENTVQKTGRHVALSVTKIQGIFYFLLIGYIVSFGVFLCEIFSKRD